MGIENIWLIALGGFLAFVSNVMYMMGGTEGFGKFWRRFIGSFVLACACNGIALAIGQWDWRYLLTYPALAIGMSLGYGANTNIIKALKRALFAAGVLSACVIGAWVAQFSFWAWLVLITCGLFGTASVILGVLNPFNNAPLEQFLISQILTMYVPFLAFIRSQ
jgi:hypothetical protein